VIFYDPHDAQDRHYVDEALRPAFPRARFIAIPYAGHPANQFLGEIGFIAPYMRAVVAAGTEPMPDRRLKAKSSMYHQVLAEACLAHRKPRWALALATRSLELNPRMELAYRTLGEAELALGRIDEAETHLRRFAERSPLDGVAHQALHKVAAARAERAASAALLRGSGPPLWRRAIARAVGPLWRKR
jgi:predicted Zn-dependent protease